MRQQVLERFVITGDPVKAVSTVCLVPHSKKLEDSGFESLSWSWDLSPFLWGVVHVLPFCVGFLAPTAQRHGGLTRD